MDPEVAEINHAQARIGWDQIMIGRFAINWNTHAQTQPGTTPKHLGNWTTTVIDFIFSQWWKLWESRNHDRHGRDIMS